MVLDRSELEESLRSILDEVLGAKLAAILPAILDSKLNPITTSLEGISNCFDEQKEKILKLEEANKVLESENKFLKEQTASLWKEVNDVKTVIDEQEQYGRRECLEIRGIPTTAREDTDEVVQSIGTLLDIDIDETDISVSHRMPASKSQGSATSRSFPPAIVVKFTNRNVRDRLYRSRTKLKDFKVSDIGLGRLGDGQIYIQESLTARRRMLFKQCLEARKNKQINYKFIWTYYGSIYLRKNESSPAVRINSVVELDKLQKREPAEQVRANDDET